MLVEVGPVSFRSAVAWLDYANSSLEVLAGRTTTPLPEGVAASFLDLLEEWRNVEEEGGNFHWSGERDSDEVRYLTKALYEAGLAVEEAFEVGLMPLRPPEADEFHIMLVQGLVAGLEREGGSYAQFADALRNDWGVARLP